jgi:hypothetical protein
MPYDQPTAGKAAAIAPGEAPSPERASSARRRPGSSERSWTAASAFATLLSLAASGHGHAAPAPAQPTAAPPAGSTTGAADPAQLAQWFNWFNCWQGYWRKC